MIRTDFGDTTTSHLLRRGTLNVSHDLPKWKSIELDGRVSYGNGHFVLVQDCTIIVGHTLEELCNQIGDYLKKHLEV